MVACACDDRPRPLVARTVKALPPAATGTLENWNTPFGPATVWALVVPDNETVAFGVVVPVKDTIALVVVLPVPPMAELCASPKLWIVGATVCSVIVTSTAVWIPSWSVAIRCRT